MKNYIYNEKLLVIILVMIVMNSSILRSCAMHTARALEAEPAHGHAGVTSYNMHFGIYEMKRTFFKLGNCLLSGPNLPKGLPAGGINFR